MQLQQKAWTELETKIKAVVSQTAHDVATRNFKRIPSHYQQIAQSIRILKVAQINYYEETIHHLQCMLDLLQQMLDDATDEDFIQISAPQPLLKLPTVSVVRTGKRGRPRLHIDENELRQVMGKQQSFASLAFKMKVSESTLQRRASEYNLSKFVPTTLLKFNLVSN